MPESIRKKSQCNPKNYPSMQTGLLALSGANGRKMNILPKPSPEAITDLASSIVSANPDLKEPFYVFDLGLVIDLFKKWTTALPDVKPFYAVKCNREPALIGILASLGAGFDCASLDEIEAILTAGVRPDRIIHANTCKPEPHIKYAAATGVNLATFDSIYELEKIRRLHPKCSLLLRLKTPEERGARYPLGDKFGALPEEVTPLLLAARSTGIDVVGVAFHVGSGATNFETYRLAIASARSAFDAADQLGTSMQVLNIGGGFTAGPQFDEAAHTIKLAINEYFSDLPDLKLMAEPGRYFAETAFTLVTNIIGKRVRGEVREYWIDDGMHGSMSGMKYNIIDVTVEPLQGGGKEETFSSTVYGPTCDGRDRVLIGVQLPELLVGDSLVSPNMGAYTVSMGTSFNGFITSAIKVHLAYSNTS